MPNSVRSPGSDPEDRDRQTRSCWNRHRLGSPVPGVPGSRTTHRSKSRCSPHLSRPCRRTEWRFIMDEKAGFNTGDTPTTRCAFYRSCGLAAVVQSEPQRIVIAAGPHVGAVTMPAELGTAARRLLFGRGLTSGPVISHPRSGRWTFLITPDIPYETPLFAEMFRRNVSVVRSGAIVLPVPTRRSAAFRTWIAQPRVTVTQPPSGMALVAAVRECPVGRESRP